MPKLTLLADDGALSAVALNESPGYTRPEGPLRSRVAYAAAHVVPRTWADNTPSRPAEVDWELIERRGPEWMATWDRTIRGRG